MQITICRLLVLQADSSRLPGMNTRAMNRDAGGKQPTSISFRKLPVSAANGGSCERARNVVVVSSLENTIAAKQRSTHTGYTAQ